MATTVMDESEIPKTPRTPRTPKMPLRTFSRTFSLDPCMDASSRNSGSWYTGTPSLMSSTTHEEDPPPKYEPRLFTVGFTIKLVQWGLAILCTGMHSEGSTLIMSFTTQLFPYIVYWTYMMVTGNIILSYLLGQKMREILIRIYNILGSVLFLAASAVTLRVVVSNWRCWEKHMNSNMHNVGRQRAMLATEGALSMLNSFLYAADTVYSLRSSYATVTLPST